MYLAKLLAVGIAAFLLCMAPPAAATGRDILADDATTTAVRTITSTLVCDSKAGGPGSRCNSVFCPCSEARYNNYCNNVRPGICSCPFGSCGSAADLAALTNTVTALRTDLTDLEGTVEGLNTDLTALQGTVEGLDTDLTALEVTVDELGNDLDGLSFIVTGLQGTINGLTLTVTSQATAIDGLTDTVTNQGTAITGLQTELDALEDTVGDIITQLGVMGTRGEGGLRVLGK
jgi:uncharacterized coiled-coil protein SlyX